MVRDHQLVTEVLRVTVRNPETGMSYDPKRYMDKEVKHLGRDYGKVRKARQQKEREVRHAEWRNKTPDQQMKWLDRYIHRGAKKQRARLEKILATSKPAKSEVPEPVVAIATESKQHKLSKVERKQPRGPGRGVFVHHNANRR